ncbi:MAG: glutathione S-transferase family protein [Pseudomonadota bacterium]
MADEMRVWGMRTARPMRVLWMLEEFGLEYDHRPIGSRTGETKTEEYLALNPKHKIPTFEHGAFVLTESGAICSYIADRFETPDGFHMPETPEARARMMEWCCFLLMEVDALGIYVIRRHLDLGDLYGHADNVVQSARAYISDGLANALKKWPEGQEYLLEGGFSIPDIHLASMMGYMRSRDVQLPARVHAHFERCSARPAYRRAEARCYPGDGVSP